MKNSTITVIILSKVINKEAMMKEVVQVQVKVRILINKMMNNRVVLLPLNLKTLQLSKCSFVKEGELK